MEMKKIRSARSKEKTEKRVSVNFTQGIRSFPHDGGGKWCYKVCLCSSKQGYLMRPFE